VARGPPRGANGRARTHPDDAHGTRPLLCADEHVPNVGQRTDTASPVVHAAPISRTTAETEGAGTMPTDPFNIDRETTETDDLLDDTEGHQFSVRESPHPDAYHDTDDVDA
jgi:hypothetical protein